MTAPKAPQQGAGSSANSKEMGAGYELMYYRGDVVMVDLGSGRGSEQGGVRPAVIVSNNIGNINGPTVIIAPITSREKHHLPTHAPLESVPGLGGRSMALAEQLRTVDKTYIIKTMCILDAAAMCRVDKAVECAICSEGVARPTECEEGS